MALQTKDKNEVQSGYWQGKDNAGSVLYNGSAEASYHVSEFFREGGSRMKKLLVIGMICSLSVATLGFLGTSNIPIDKIQRKLPSGAQDIVDLGNSWYQFRLQDSYFLIRILNNTSFGFTITELNEKLY